ncbi:ROK family protein [uncultured Parolsenella sp.]|uniref:ROK family protein n=1 Tax=uncultured Parolsenella sp. TaxID=2083008 RepID=UPI0027D9859B|nr:ROK family protein [uncultured Parolsenella sp.]
MRITQTRDIRSVNRREVFRCLLDHYPLSRQELCGRTGLNKSTVSVIVKEWMERGLVVETERGASASGRKPIMLQPSVNAGFAVAIDLDVSHFTVMTCDLSGERVLDELRLPIEQTDFPTVCGRLFSAVDALVARRPASRYGLIGIGIAVHGIVDLTGTIRFVPQLDWHDIDVRSLFAERYGIPVLVDNDGNFAVTVEQRAEIRLGEGTGDDPDAGRDLSFVSISDTISGGQVVNGRLLRGHHGFANAIGHHTVQQDEPVRCRCGRYGCWEQYCSDVAVLSSASALRGEPVRSMDEFVDLVRHQDPAAREALDRFLTHLAIGLTNIISIFDTQLIAINARLLNEFPSYLPEVQRRMTLPITHFETVVLARTGGRGAVLGAADAAVDRFFEGLSVGEGEPERP